MKISAAATALLTAILALGCAQPDMSRFLGEWQPDQERSLAAIHESAKPGMQISRMGELTQQMLEDARMTVSKNEIVFSAASQSRRIGYTLKGASADSATIEVVRDGKAEEGIFTLIEGRYLKLTTSGEGDMDYLIWRRVDPGE